MEELYNCEPLNLVKRKTKPVAVVAPSAVHEASEEEDDEEEGKVEDLRVKKEVEVEDVNKNCFWDKTGREVYQPSEIRGCPAVSVDPGLLTTLYMRSLVASGVIPPGYLSSYPLYPSPEPQFSPLWAQQRFWQMVQLNEAHKSPKTDSLSIAVPPQAPLKKTAPPAVLTAVPDTDPPPLKTKKTKQKRSSMDHKNSLNDGKSQDSSNNQDKKKPHIKKPLNAFMLYMKEMRAKVVAECTLKESAAINQILGRRWHSLTREEQAKYYEKARQERQLHMELYPGWSARDNYGYGAKKKKRKKERVPISDPGGSADVPFDSAGSSDTPQWHALGRDEQAKYYELARRERQLHMQLYPDWSSRANTNRGKKRKRKQDTNDGGNNMKKCRARYGLDQQSQWCKPCRRKKKCIRYMECGDGDDGNQSDYNLGSCGSVGEATTPPDYDGESTGGHSLSSPGGLSGLSSLTSPSMVLPSPSASLASPSVSLASPSVSLASPCMSLQSPLTPSQLDYDCKPPPLLPLLVNHLHVAPPHRHPVGTNPHDINNPLSVNQLTGKCIKNSSSTTSGSNSTGSSKDSNRPVISVI